MWVGYAGGSTTGQPHEVQLLALLFGILGAKLTRGLALEMRVAGVPL
jgi:hypothetical protein